MKTVTQLKPDTMEKQIEPNNVVEYVLIFPEQKKGSRLREWLLLQLVHVGYEATGVDDFVYGRFPQTVRIKPYIEETEEMRAILKMYLDGNRVEIQGESMEAVK